jgi:signal transduction histidine kinase
LDQVDIGVFSLQVDSDQWFWNASLYRLLGLEIGEVRPSVSALLDRLDHEDAARLQASFQKLTAAQPGKGGSRLFDELRVKTTDGNPKWLAIRCNAAIKASQEARTVFGFVWNITEEKRNEHQLLQSTEELEERVQERAGMLKLLHDVASTCHRVPNVDDAVDYVLHRFAEYNGWCFGHAYAPNPDNPEALEPFNGYHAAVTERFEKFRQVTERLRLRRGQGLPGRVFQTGKAATTNDVEDDLVQRRAELDDSLDLHSAIAFPVVVEDDEVAIVLEFFSDETIDLDERIKDGVHSVGTQLAYVVERKRLEKQLVDAVMSEQRTIAHELHDSVGQRLAALSMTSDRLARKLLDESSAHAPAAQQIAQDVRNALQGVRAAARGLVPVPVEAGGMAMALEELANSFNEREGIECRFEGSGDLSLSDDIKATHVYRIAQEAVNNAARHSQATTILIRLRVADHSLLMEVADNGVGISSNALSDTAGLGLRAMHHRANVIGARLSIDRSAQGGTLVQCILPRSQ